MKLDEFVAALADQFEDTDPSEITKETNFRELDEWDSLTALTVIAFVKTTFSKSITAQEIRQCNTVEDLFNLVEKK